ncbi:NAD-glutamate dehydrogenase [Ferrimonas lipolytica]|uniref:NAD-glutamate dehydrogenase n=1 Tax=Ferrimonas lipolytica TaxID=2724191 RepID=A0A6H1UBX5_9GAMM|nr:NAD-glutamate dehydrogenase [Ferrimonas lipolytica]QIZ76565.1 NAD-glutamate dehydrogenase [Ferrimonas lipolytica]
MARMQTRPSVMLDNVIALIHQKNEEQQAQLLEKLARILFGTLSHDDLNQRNDSELYGATLSLWQNLNSTPSGQSFNRVYNPVQSTHGWQSAHTIVEMVQPDMPFLVDSVTMALQRFNIASHLTIHAPIAIARDESGAITEVCSILDASKSHERVSVFLVEVENLQLDEKRNALSKELTSILEDINASVEDWQKMQAKLTEVVKQIDESPLVTAQTERDHALDFLGFLANHHFTFLGYRYYDLEKVEGDLALVADHDSSLGTLRIRPSQHRSILLSELPEAARKDALQPNYLVLTKTNAKSRVHRPAYVDYVGIKRFNDSGQVIGEHRFIGLYASTMYNKSTDQIPLLKQKLHNVMALSGMAPYSHDYKALANILETYPRDELIQANEKQLYDTAVGILQMQERDKVKLFIRKDVFGRFVSALVYTTKDRYNTELRIRTQKLLADSFHSKDPVEFTTYFSESRLARTHYQVKVANNDMDVDLNELENNLIELARTWDDKLDSALVESRGEAKGKTLSNQFVHAFPRSYKEDVIPSVALGDIDNLTQLSEDNKLGMLFYQPQEVSSAKGMVSLKLFHKDEPIPLSDILPMLENFGLRVIGERPYKVIAADGNEYWILDFSMMFKRVIDEPITSYQKRFEQALAETWRGRFEDDAFNSLVLSAGLTGVEVTVLRAYARYMQQIGVTFSQQYIAQTLEQYPQITQLLMQMFRQRFNPSNSDGHCIEALQQAIVAQLDDVANLDDDRIIRRFAELIQASLRTNFYQQAADGQPKSYLSIKFQPELIPEIPLPVPKFEVFVYSSKVEGVHLRGAKVARGGLRWSDRREDFRTEVLGLVKAQQVKNTVIVPSGAKGGFVCKQLPLERDAMLTEGKSCYRTFIRGLLDITDNIVQGELTPPIDVVRHDEDDSYLVVAADKGTATFSDIANSISEEYNFWLGDAFASGGQFGYDHKKMGITARGAWESVMRHFREIDIDCQNSDFTCLAVGDMAGDVFGNGMLLSKHTRLQVAFNHMHIFIDPNPDAAVSYVERQRLFELPRSSWTDYDDKLISKGGGIFLRSAKSIKLTPEIKKMLQTQQAKMTPNELIHNLLQMDVDLLWNGGIGTYVKATSETHLDVGDRANDAVRINGNQLKAKIVGEGGNLGLTQLGRIEYAQTGGRINTDFVDNVGGVDCSDNEVNIKILLNRLVAEGELTVKQRNKLLVEMTEEVSDIVLADCRDQTLSISITELRDADQIKEQIRFIHYLEKMGRLDRSLEFLPTDEELSERVAAGQGLTRPEISVLVAYAKMVLKEQLVDPVVTNNDAIAQRLIRYFPQGLQKRFADWMQDHPLRGEIIATSLANDIINNMGFNFIQRMQDETSASVSEIAISYTIASQIFDFDSVKDEIIACDGVVASAQQYKMMYQMQRTVRRATRWFLRHRSGSTDVAANVGLFRPVVHQLADNFDSLLAAEEADFIQELADKLIERHVPQQLAQRVVRSSTLFSALDLAEIAELDNKPVLLVAETYYRLGSRIDMHWFLTQINEQPVANHWQALARAGFREELDILQRQLTLTVLRNCVGSCSAESIIDQWVAENAQSLDRWLHMMAEFRTSKNHEFAKFSVALRELSLLIVRCDNVA